MSKEANSMEHALKQEPVAWIETQTKSFMTNNEFENNPFANEQQGNWKPLYTAPQQRPSRSDIKPLTPHEIGRFVGTHSYGPEQLKWFRFGEAAHGIKE